ncbi:MAG: immunity 41 family protein [Tannerella sp.]|jgi:hypothetical protein|nr:immunity 41 family protein [Tannerella sp.]
MKKISTVYLHIFRMEEHYEFLVVLKALAQKYPAVQTLITAYINALSSQIDLEKALINNMQKSDYTKLIAEADVKIDQLINGMERVIDAALRHFDPSVVQAAQALHNRFKAFGRITRKAYEEETADVNILLGDLKNDSYADKVTLLGLSPWVTQLTEDEATFEHLIEQRNVEYAGKPQEHLKDVRRDSDILCRNIFDRVDSAATMATTPLYDDFINELNARIDYFNDHAHQHARRDISVAGHCIVEDVAEQTYTGKPLTPQTRAYYREEGKPTVELVSGQDFFITYRNNVEVGTADLILHGRNAYRGQKKTTFNIARAK